MVERKSVIYARCSTTGQKENLERQIERLKVFSAANLLLWCRASVDKPDPSKGKESVISKLMWD
jgi:predicted site-specific integrase-resolvase